MIQAFVFGKNKCQCSLRLSDPTLYMTCCFIVADVFSLFVRCYSLGDFYSTTSSIDFNGVHL